MGRGMERSGYGQKHGQLWRRPGSSNAVCALGRGQKIEKNETFPVMSWAGKRTWPACVRGRRSGTANLCPAQTSDEAALAQSVAWAMQFSVCAVIFCTCCPGTVLHGVLAYIMWQLNACESGALRFCLSPWSRVAGFLCLQVPAVLR